MNTRMRCTVLQRQSAAPPGVRSGGCTPGGKCTSRLPQSLIAPFPPCSHILSPPTFTATPTSLLSISRCQCSESRHCNCCAIYILPQWIDLKPALGLSTEGNSMGLEDKGNTLVWFSDRGNKSTAAMRFLRKTCPQSSNTPKIRAFQRREEGGIEEHRLWAQNQRHRSQERGSKNLLAG